MHAPKTISIGNKKIGEGHPVYIIAEVGINHNGSLQIARQLIKHAAECGASAVKFQKRNLKTLYQEKVIDQPLSGHRGVQYLLPLFKDFEFSYEEYRQILSYCEEFRIQFLCTPFDKESVDFLEKLRVPAYKIGSPDLTNIDLLEYVASKKKPLIISTGMSTWDEIQTSVKFLKQKKTEFIVLHCNSNYPAPFHSINLRLIPRLQKEFNCLVGYSGHEYGIAISQAAVALGACVVERHFTLDRTMIGPDHAASLEPVGLKTMIRDIRHIEQALGTGEKILDRGEFMNRETLGKSLVASQLIKTGTTIKKSMLISKSPGTGISPQRIDEVIGKTAIRDIPADDQITEMDIKSTITKNKQHSYHFKHTWGIMTRYTDFEGLMNAFNAALTEFHLTDQDLQDEWLPKSKITKDLVVHAPEYCEHDLFDLCSNDERIREKSINALKKVIVKAKKLTPFFNTKVKPKIVIHPGGMIQAGPFVSIDDGEIKKLYANLAKSIRPFKESADYDLLLENMPPYPWYFGGQWQHTVFMDADEIYQFCKKEKIRLCLDISHGALYCNLKKIPLHDFVKTLIPITKHIHIADAANGIDGEGLQIGEGGINFIELKKSFKEYKNSFTVEIWQGHKENGKGFATALEKLEKLSIL